jgi:hypothetical protein
MVGSTTVLLGLLTGFVSVNGQSSAKVLKPFSLREGQTAHSLSSGPIVVNDSRTITIPDLYYDGTGPDAFFLIGKGPPPAERPPETPGEKIPNEKGSYEVLKKYSGETVVLRLPENYRIDEYDWLAMYCIKFKHTFGYVAFEHPLNVPEARGPEQKTLEPFRLQNGKTAHGLSSGPIIVNDTKTIIIPNLHYDGKGPDAFWMVGYGEPPVERPSATPGHKIPNEIGNCGVLKAYNGENIVLRLPGNFTV